MNDTYQGRTDTISPVFGRYYTDHFIQIDRQQGVTGASGVTGAGTLVPWKNDQYVTGAFTDNQTI